MKNILIIILIGSKKHYNNIIKENNLFLCKNIWDFLKLNGVVKSCLAHKKVLEALKQVNTQLDVRKQVSVYLKIQ